MDNALQAARAECGGCALACGAELSQSEAAQAD
jgi:hypothetical protein